MKPINDSNLDVELTQLQPKVGEHSFAPIIRILGKGKTGTRSLSFAEAKHAMSMILRGEVEPEQLGAFLMLLRVKEESPAEIAGFVAAVREQLPSPPDNRFNSASLLDWPTYAGKRAQHPWYILSALLLQQVNIQVLMHGSAGHTHGRLYSEQVVQSLGLPIVQNLSQAVDVLNGEGFGLIALKSFCPALQNIIELRNILGLRSPVHTLTRLINPLLAEYSMQSVFHPAYSATHQSASEILAGANTAVFKGDSGEIERKPEADTTVKFCRNGQTSQEVWPRLQKERQPGVVTPSAQAILALWRGDIHDDYGLRAVIGTTAIALRLCNKASDTAGAEALATRLWQQRPRNRI